MRLPWVCRHRPVGLTGSPWVWVLRLMQTTISLSVMVLAGRLAIICRVIVRTILPSARPVVRTSKVSSMWRWVMAPAMAWMATRTWRLAEMLARISLAIAMSAWARMRIVGCHPIVRSVLVRTPARKQKAWRSGTRRLPVIPGSRWAVRQRHWERVQPLVLMHMQTAILWPWG